MPNLYLCHIQLLLRVKLKRMLGPFAHITWISMCLQADVAEAAAAEEDLLDDTLGADNAGAEGAGDGDVLLVAEGSVGGGAAVADSASAAPVPAVAPGLMPPPPAPPVPPPPSASSRGGERGDAQFVVRHPNGWIAYYPLDQRFQATCGVCPPKPSGAKCRLTRTAHASASRPAQGRPLGLMWAWLDHGPTVSATGFDHTDRYFVRLSFPKDVREAARETCHGQPLGAQLQSCERPRRDGEGPEPDANA